MKKVFLLAGCLSLFAVTFTACPKPAPEGGCTCVIQHAGSTTTKSYTLRQMKDMYSTSYCSTLASTMNKEDYLEEARISCTENE